MIRRFVHAKAAPLASAVLLCLPGIAQAAEPPCLTPVEFTALSTYALPGMISGTAQRCAPALPAEAFLKRGSGEMVQRYARVQGPAWSAAKPAVLKLVAFGNPQLAETFKAMPDANLQQMAGAFIEGMVTQRVPLERCGAIDRLLRLLAPLPPENTAELIALGVGLSSRSGRARFGNLSICPAAAGTTSQEARK